MTLWQIRLAEFRLAQEQYAEAKRLMRIAERAFDKLSKRMDDNRAYEIAGVSLADNRSIRAYQVRKCAVDALAASLAGYHIGIARIISAAVVRDAFYGRERAANNNARLGRDKHTS